MKLLLPMLLTTLSTGFAFTAQAIECNKTYGITFSGEGTDGGAYQGQETTACAIAYNEAKDKREESTTVGSAEVACADDLDGSFTWLTVERPVKKIVDWTYGSLGGQLTTTVDCQAWWKFYFKCECPVTTPTASASPTTTVPPTSSPGSSPMNSYQPAAQGGEYHESFIQEDLIEEAEI